MAVTASIRAIGEIAVQSAFGSSILCSCVPAVLRSRSPISNSLKKPRNKGANEFSHHPPPPSSDPTDQA